MLAVVVAAVLPLVAGTAVSPAEAATIYPSSAKQLITVRVSSSTATVGKLRAYDRVNGVWKLRFGPVTARVGAAGVGKASEGSTRTPRGSYPLTGAFGRLSDPGTTMPYFKTDRYDWWDSNSSSRTYNQHVRGADPGGPSENLHAAGAVYDHAVVIGYNRLQVPGAGSAFFLHRSNGRSTAGCVAVSKPNLVRLLRWLDPGKNPWIRIGVY